LVKHTNNDTLAGAGQKLVGAILEYRPETGKTRTYALWSQIQGWGGYGFIEGYAASFAITGYKTAYLSVHHTAEFIADEEVLQRTTVVFLLSPAVFVRGTVEYRGKGVALSVHDAKPLILPR
jgi:hypothetical protein